MILLSADAARHRWADIEAAVDVTPAIDPWCSGPDWVQPVAAAFAESAEPLILEVPNAGFALLAEHTTDTDEIIIAGLEPLWGFASPIVGVDPDTVAKHLARWLFDRPNWSRLVLPGQPNDGRLLTTLARRLSVLGEVGVADGITRQVVDLAQGHGAWLSRRRPAFRRNLRNAQRKAAAAGIDLTPAESDRFVFDRIMAIERQSWKGLSGDGITSPQMNDFYRRLVPRLSAQGRLRVAIAESSDGDIGYILGGVRQRRYRGLQLSYAESAGSLSISHLLQLSEIERLAKEGVQTYDMGMDMDYKRRWADHSETSHVLIVDRLVMGRSQK